MALGHWLRPLHAAATLTAKALPTPDQSDHQRRAMIAMDTSGYGEGLGVAVALWLYLLHLTRNGEGQRRGKRQTS